MTTVLVADPDMDTRRILSTVLRDEGMNVIETHDAENACYLLQRHGVDVVVLNYPLRLSEGVTLTRAIREDARLANVPIVNFTSHVTPSSRADAKADGVTYTIEKPAHVYAIVNVVRALTDRSSHHK